MVKKRAKKAARAKAKKPPAKPVAKGRPVRAKQSPQHEEE